MWRDRLALARACDLTLGVVMDRLATVHGDGHVLAEEDGADTPALTCGGAAEAVARLAGSLVDRVDPGDRVLVAGLGGYASFLACLAVARLGAVAVPVSPQLTQPEVDHIAADAEARVTISSVEGLATGPPVAARPVDPGDVAVIFYTSGTTGRPKGARLTHRSLLGPLGRVALVPPLAARREAVSGMPVCHIGGFSMLLLLAGAGIPVYLLGRFHPERALDAIEARRAGMFVGVPAMYRMMIEAGAEHRDLRSVRLWASGGDAMPVGLARRYQAMGAATRLPGGRSFGRAAFIDGYGMVELGGGAVLRVSLPGPDLGRGGLLGVTMPGYRVQVVDEGGAPLRRGQVGELVVRGPGVMAGYHGSDGATARVLDGDGWLRTEDLARRRGLGLVELVGRKKDVINSGGYSVFAAEVEDALGRHPAVAEVAVVGLSRSPLGEVPVAVTVPVRADEVSEEELLAWLAGRLATFKLPRRILFVDRLPTTENGKVQKDVVRAVADQELADGAATQGGAG